MASWSPAQQSDSTSLIHFEVTDPSGNLDEAAAEVRVRAPVPSGDDSTEIPLDLRTAIVE